MIEYFLFLDFRVNMKSQNYKKILGIFLRGPRAKVRHFSLLFVLPSSLMATPLNFSSADKGSRLLYGVPGKLSAIISEVNLHPAADYLLMFGIASFFKALQRTALAPVTPTRSLSPFLLAESHYPARQTSCSLRSKVGSPIFAICK